MKLVRLHVLMFNRNLRRFKVISMAAPSCKNKNTIKSAPRRSKIDIKS